MVHLLALARSESGVEAVDASRFEIAAAVDSAWRRVAVEARRKGIELRRDVAPALLVETDRGKLELMVTNLLANAVAYCPAGGTVECNARAEVGGTELRVANPAPELDDADLPHLFDRFWRKDTARTGGQHAGLGLTLVQTFADLLGIGVEVALSPERVFTITLQLPVPAAVGQKPAARHRCRESAPT